MEINEIELLENIKDNYVIVENQWWNPIEPLVAYVNDIPESIPPVEVQKVLAPNQALKLRKILNTKLYEVLLQNHWIEYHTPIHHGIEIALKITDLGLQKLAEKV